MTPSARLSPPTVEGDAVEAALDRLFGAGRAAHPTLRLARDELARGARDRAAWTVDDDGGTELDALAAMERRGRAGDLFLVVACDLGRDGAWERLVEAALPAVARALAAQGVPPAEADALAGELPGHLIQAPRHERSRTRLGGYRAASSLSTFLAVAALALRASERRARTVASLDQMGAAAAAAIPAGDVVPVASAEDAEAAARLEAALPVAWARLTRQESLALLFKVRDGLPQTTIATLLGVGPPRVSRLIDQAHGRLRAALAEGDRGAGVLAGAPPAALRSVIERFLATSYAGVRPGGAPGASAPARRSSP